MKKTEPISGTDGHKPHQHGASPPDKRERLERERKGMKLRKRCGAKCFGKQLHTSAEVLKVQ